jgi:probable HAF family extracellular repeat protein
VRNQSGGFSSFDVPGPINTGIGTQTRGISERGDIVGWFMTSGGKRRGFLLSQGQFTFIDYPDAIGTDTDGINSETDMVGGYDGVDGKHHAYVLTR